MDRLSREMGDLRLDQGQNEVPSSSTSQGQSDRGCGDFLRMGIPTTKIKLNNTSGEKFYDNAGPDLDNFLDQHGERIISLRVKLISVLPQGNEKKFLDRLVNLEVLEADGFAAKPAGRSTEEMMTSIPDVFKRLRSLRIGNINMSQWCPGILLFSTRILSECKRLEIVSLPYCQPHGITNDDDINTFNDFYDALNSCIVRNGLKVFDHGGFFQQSDPLNIEDIMNVAGSFLHHCLLCSQRGVNLMNFRAYWLLPLNLMDRLPPDVCRTITSLIDLQPCVLARDICNLQMITIKETSQSGIGDDWNNHRRCWNLLEYLDVNVDSKEGRASTISPEWIINHQNEATTRLFKLFFMDVKRPSLVNLRLNFIKERDQVAIPKMSDIASACPNLKKLIIRNWPGTNKSLIKLFSELTGLEQLSLEYCKGLGNVAFVGLDIESPIFLKMTNLKQLQLLGLDHMPKITDLVFSRVIRHLNLNSLIISSETPVENVTGAGIRSLLDGCFAKSIKKFPFSTWSVADMTMDDFSNLGKEFRM